MTNEACNQLKDIMMFSGFPEECLAEQNSFDANNSDTRLDIITSLLAYALSPNVCFHLEKRKVITCDGKQALIHKNSVNCGRSGEMLKFASPFFVFGEKIKTRAVSAKQMTMVTPIQLLLFASDNIETVPEQNLICLDSWINIKIEFELASTIALIRSAMNSVIATCTLDPNIITNPSAQITQFIDLIKMLSDQENKYLIFNKVDENSAIRTNYNQATNYSSISNTITLAELMDSNEPAPKRFQTANEPNQPMNETPSQESSNDLSAGFFIDKRGGNFYRDEPKSFSRGAGNSFRGGNNNNFRFQQNQFQTNQQYPTNNNQQIQNGRPIPPHLLNSAQPTELMYQSEDNYQQNNQQFNNIGGFNQGFNNNGNFRGRFNNNQGNRGGFRGGNRGGFRGGFRGGVNRNFNYNQANQN